MRDQAIRALKGSVRAYPKEVIMDRMQKEALQVTKEIVVKFIETQRVSPSNFAEIFPTIYGVVSQTIANGAHADAADDYADHDQAHTGAN